MAEIRRFPFLRHLRAEPNYHVLRFTKGKLKKSEDGASFWFHPLSTAIAEIPVDDRELQFTFHGRSADFQDVTVQGVITYRITEPVTLARRIDFSIDLKTGGYVEQPIEKLALSLSQLAQQHAWAYIAETPVRVILKAGQAEINRRVSEGLSSDASLAEIGLEVVMVRLAALSPTADLEKALEAPTREEIQQEADEAAFQRRAAAVEKERAIAENELQTEIELAKRRERLIGQEGANGQRAAREEATAAKIRIEASAQRGSIEANSLAETQRIEASASADATRLTGKAEAEKIRSIGEARVAAEKERMEAYGKLPSSAAWALAAKELAQHLKSIDHISLTPDILTPILGRLAEAGVTKLEARS